MTSGSAKAEARLTAGQAVLERLAPIAVAQFMQDPNKQEHLKELQKRESYGIDNRTDYVKKQGWATMPGEKEPDSRIAAECARRILALDSRDYMILKF